MYTPNASLISSLDQQLFAQINSQDASTPFPGFQPLPNYTLTAIQANTEAALQVASELQYVRQLLITLIEVEATKASEEMNERSQEVAASAAHFNGGTMP